MMSPGPAPQGPRIELYANNYGHAATWQDLVMYFIMKANDDPNWMNHPDLTLHLPLPMAKLLAFTLRRAILAYEAEAGVIPIHRGMLDDIKIAPEDWEYFWKTYHFE